METPVTAHSGQPLDPSVDLFVRAPAEIGTVHSAGSTLTREEQPTSLFGRLRYSFAFGLAALVAGVVLVKLFGVTKLDVRTGILASFALVGTFVGWYGSALWGRVTYVGSDGLAEIACHTTRRRFTQRDVWAFQPDAVLRRKLAPWTEGGKRVGTDYEVTWIVRGEVRFKIEGMQRHDRPPPLEPDRLEFARAAEAAWSRWISARLVDGMKDQLEFKLPSGCARVRRGELELALGGEAVRLPRAAIASATVEGDVGERLVLRRTAGEPLVVPLGEMPNALAFLLVLKQLVGVEVA